MNTTVKSLQDAYVALGGELTDTYEEIANGVPVSDYTTNPDVIEAIAQIAGKTLELPKTTSADAGSLLVVNEDGDWDKGDAPAELPPVTASDNGSVLSVVNGAWAKDDGSYSIDSVNLATTAGSKTSVPFGEFENEIILQFNNAVLSGTGVPVKVSYQYYGSDTELFKIPATETTFKKVVIIKKIAYPNNKNAVIAICGEHGGTFATSIAGTSIPGIDFTVDGSTHFTSGTIAVYRR